jgi:hypothetical protein
MDEQKILNEVTARAAVDAEYRKRLLANPHQAIAEVCGVTPPKDLKIRFIEKPAGVDVAAVLPDLIPNADQLTPEELEAVAGGDCGITCVWSCGCTNSIANC